MKKIICVILALLIVLNIPIFAQDVSYAAYSIKPTAADISGTNLTVFLSSCSGHYYKDLDAVIIYIQNTSANEIDFQVCVGWAKSTVDTSVESGFVTLKPGVTGKFILEDISQFPEKSNDDLGYLPGTALSERSIIRIQAQNFTAGDSFNVIGITTAGAIKNSSLADFPNGAIINSSVSKEVIDNAKRVIKDENSEENKEAFGYTLELVKDSDKLIEMSDGTKNVKISMKLIELFIKVIIVSAILCVCGLVLYTFIYIFKRRKKNDGAGKV